MTATRSIANEPSAFGAAHGASLRDATGGTAPPRTRWKEVTMFSVLTGSGRRPDGVCSHPNGRTSRSTRTPNWVPAAAAIAIGLAWMIATPASSPAADVTATVLVDQPEASALVVEAETRCSDYRMRSPEAVVRWRVDSSAVPKSNLVNELEAARDFRVDFSIYPDGLERGEFQSIVVPKNSVADPTAHLDLPKGATHPSAGREMLLEDLQPGVTYRVRVLALTSQGWLASDRYMFRAPICPVDMDDEAAGGDR